MNELWIAIGNPLRGEDNTAHELLPKAARHVVQLTPEMAAEFPKYDKVIFADADVTTCKRRMRPITEEAEVPEGPLTHHCAPGYVVALARRLYDWKGEAWVCSFPVMGNFD